ncbi:unnamed protein product [Phaedon cochleariae]|uniref:Indole-3-acetaldehyde oxidase n=1 Tax=Phaedon cochleariae TaxID=80249 RepID=A0A9P0DR49_PHACE|nr:unnamed protein product [Phaedon cochleariae]
MDSRQDLHIFVNGKLQKVSTENLSPTTTLNTYLREHLNLTGTKRMCLEGGCGTCVVTITRLNPLTTKYETLGVNSCLVSIFSCYGWEIETIEGIGNSGKPHKLQDAITDYNGSQCGYCTPGMIMNMYSLLQADQNISKEQVEKSFGGNICRCTGYRPILDAFKSVCKDHNSNGKFADIEEMPRCCALNNGTDNPETFVHNSSGTSWIRVSKYSDLIRILKSYQKNGVPYMLVGGNTSKGVYPGEPQPTVYVDIQRIGELVEYTLQENELILGANTTLTSAMNLFNEVASCDSRFGYLKKLANHIDLIANVPVRNIGTLAGNLMIKHKHKEFPSDIFLILETAKAKLLIVDADYGEVSVLPSEFLKMSMNFKIIRSITFTAFDDCYYYESFKIMPRAQNAHALVNAGFLVRLSREHTVEEANIVFGCINPDFVHPQNLETFLIGKKLFKNETLQDAFRILGNELKPDHVSPDPKPEFRKKLAISLFYKYVLRIAPVELISKRNLSAKSDFSRPLSKGAQIFDTNVSTYPVSKPVSKVESVFQATGEAKYLTDLPDSPEQLYAAFVLAKASPGSSILKIDTQPALVGVETKIYMYVISYIYCFFQEMEGVVTFLDKNDIPGRNTFTPTEAGVPAANTLEEELFCNGVVKYHSQPVGIVVARSRELAETAAGLVKISYKAGDTKPVFNTREILRRKLTDKIIPDMIIKPKTSGDKIRHIVEGSFDVTWQYHYHMEPHFCSANYKEGNLDLYPTTQWMDLCQNAAAAVLDIPASRVNVAVKRVGGAFGAKIVRQSMISSACALAAFKLGKPVKIWLPLEANMRVVGKRSPTSSDYEVATDENGVIQYLKNDIYVDHGQGGNEDVMFLLFEVYHKTYNSDTWSANSSFTCSDMHSSVYTRAPGSLEGFTMLEAIMEHAAVAIDMDPLEFRIRNLPKDSKTLAYLIRLREWANIDNRRVEIENYNKENRWRKKGLSVVPMAYPFSLFLGFNVIVSIYHSDGSVAISHAGIEIGQGINTKAVQVCAYKLGIPMEKVSIKQSNNLIAANSHMTGGSLTSESVCWAIMNACDTLLERIRPIREKMGDPNWEELIKGCYDNMIPLTATSTNSPKDPRLGDYVAYGACASEIELDVLTGRHQVLRVDLIEDVGTSMNPKIDMGQVEGAFIMGVGYLTSEEIVVSDEGEILTNRTWNYKPPGALDIPVDFRIQFPGKNPNPVGVFHSKAVGEPAICLAVSVPLAIRRAAASARKEADPEAAPWYPFDGPSTVENTFMNCLSDSRTYTL